VLVAFEQSWALRSPALRPEYETSDRAALAIAMGDFEEGEAQVKRYAQSIATSAEESSHFEVAERLFELYIEEGRTSEAINAVDAFDHQRSAWTPSELDSEIFLASWRYRAGAISRDEFVKRRDAWLERQNKRPHAVGQYGTTGGFQWIVAYANPAITKSDSEEALAVLPSLSPLPGPTMRMGDDRTIGRVFSLAGRPNQSVVFLRAAASSCSPLSFPFEMPRASYQLGVALEMLGDRRGACEAFGRVLGRWPVSRTRSLTAGESTRARARLRCETTP
jgi:hypothetical protein